MTAVTRAPRNIAHRLIEEFMLAANEAVAAHIEAAGEPMIFRIHDRPDPKRVIEFEEIATQFGYSLTPGAAPVKKFKAEVVALDNPLLTSRNYQKLVAKIEGKPEERILSYLMLRSLKQARYSEENVGHFALAATTYTHFTSPIRRYPDLIVHRILKEVLRDSPEKQDGEIPVGTSVPDRSAGNLPAVAEGNLPLRQALGKLSAGLASRLPDSRRGAGAATPSPWSKRRDHSAHRHSLEPLSGPISIEELHSIAEESSQSERRADDAERELMEWKKVKFMEPRIGEDFDGLIVSVTKFGLFVELTDLFVEGLVPLDTLSDDRYTYHETTRQIIGQRSRKTYRLGDRVRVLVDRIDPVEKKIQFAILDEQPKLSGEKRRQ